MMPKRPNCMRLVHEARAATTLSAPLHLLDQGLREATEASLREPRWRWPRIAPPVAPEIGPDNDRMVVTQKVDDQVLTRIELTRNGVLRLRSTSNQRLSVALRRSMVARVFF